MATGFPPVFCAGLAGCAGRVQAQVRQTADAAFFGGVIVTMNSAQPAADAVAVRLDLIQGVTTVEEARRRYRINDKARAAEHAPDFSQRIRAVD